MSEIVDDLLKEVKELETATLELESASQSAKSHEHELLKKNSEHQNALQLLNIEAIKAAQNSAQLSQQAAEASIKQGQKLKAEIFELSEANFNWRQAIRNAAKDFKAAKSSITIMLIVSIIFSLSAAATAGYFAYKLQKQNALLQGEIVDIVATEHGLLKKDITLKIDELASVIETMSYPQPPLSSQQESPALIPQKIEPIAPDLAKESLSESSAVPKASANNKNQEAEQATDENQKAPETETDIPSLVKNDQHPDLLKTELEQIKSEMSKLDKAVQENQRLLTTINTKKHSSDNANISVKNSKKLDSLSWLIRQQSKKVTALEKGIANKTTAPATKQLNGMQMTLEKIKKQQNQLKEQMRAVDKALEELTELSKEPPPYSYKAR